MSVRNSSFILAAALIVLSSCGQLDVTKLDSFLAGDSIVAGPDQIGAGGSLSQLKSGDILLHESATPLNPYPSAWTYNHFGWRSSCVATSATRYTKQYLMLVGNVMYRQERNFLNRPGVSPCDSNLLVSIVSSTQTMKFVGSATYFSEPATEIEVVSGPTIHQQFLQTVVDSNNLGPCGPSIQFGQQVQTSDCDPSATANVGVVSHQVFWTNGNILKLADASDSAFPTAGALNYFTFEFASMQAISFIPGDVPGLNGSLSNIQQGRILQKHPAISTAGFISEKPWRGACTNVGASSSAQWELVVVGSKFYRSNAKYTASDCAPAALYSRATMEYDVASLGTTTTNPANLPTTSLSLSLVKYTYQPLTADSLAGYPECPGHSIGDVIVISQCVPSVAAMVGVPRADYTIHLSNSVLRLGFDTDSVLTPTTSAHYYTAQPL